MANTFAVVATNSKAERNSCSRGRFDRSMAGRDRDREAMNRLAAAFIKVEEQLDALRSYERQLQ